MNIEAIKKSLLEGGRWVACLLGAWIITETMKQLGLVPEFINLHVWVFTYTLPFRASFGGLLTLLGRVIDKYIFESSERTKGLLPF